MRAYVPPGGALEAMRLPSSDPVDDALGLWALQWYLIEIAETELGPRDRSKKVYQPQFADDGPFLRNTPDFDGAFIELSRNAEHYWPTVVYEMAHEIVHLLDPVARGNGNYLEEGVAVAFSLHVQPMYGFNMSVKMPSYVKALNLVESLPGGVLTAGKLIRETVGALSSATPQFLAELFPEVDETICDHLAQRFDRALDT